MPHGGCNKWCQFMTVAAMLVAVQTYSLLTPVNHLISTSRASCALVAERPVLHQLRQRTRSRRTVRLHMSLADEMEAVRSMGVAEIKRELTERGLATNDIFEKGEFVSRLAQAREDNIPRNAPNPPPQPEAREGSPSAAAAAEDRSAAIQEEVRAMRVSDIKLELAQQGVGTQGLFEKSEYVALLVKARLAAPVSRGSGGGTSQNPDFKDVQTQKMTNKKEEAEKTQPKKQGGGNPFAGMGGMGGGGMAGMPNPFGGMGGAS